MATYEVITGMNLGPSGERFSPGSVVDGKDLAKLCDEETLESLIGDGHVRLLSSKRSTSGGSRRTSRTPSDATSSAGSPESEDEK